MIYLPQPLAGAGPRAYLLTGEGAGVAAQVTGINRKVLGLRAGRTGRSFLHINHTLAINDFYVGLHGAIRKIHGWLGWVDEDRLRTYYIRNGKPTLTPDGAAEIGVDQRKVRAFIEIDRGTERRLWLQAKFQRYLRHLAGRVGADQMHILFCCSGRRSRGDRQQGGRFRLSLGATAGPRRVDDDEGAAGRAWPARPSVGPGTRNRRAAAVA